MESSVEKERYGSNTRWTDGRTDGKPWEIDGNSMGRAPLGRSDTEATTKWTERKPWEI